MALALRFARNADWRGLGYRPPVATVGYVDLSYGALLAAGPSSTPTSSYPPDYGTVGTYKPSATTTGVPAGTVLTPRAGDQTVTVAGTVLDSLDITGRVLIRAANVTVQRCRIRGSGGGSANTAMVDCNNAACSNALIRDCDLVPDTPSVWYDGVIGHDYTIRRCNIRSVVDGCGVYNTSNGNGPIAVTISGCWIHDLSFWSPDPNHPDNRTHNDGIQIQGNSGITVVGNTISANASATAGNGSSTTSPAPDSYYPSVTGQGVGITPNVGAVTGITIDSNWIDFGAQSITAIPGSFGAQTIGSITNNRFGRNQPALNKGGGTARRAILIDPALTVPGFPTSTGPDVSNGNVYEDDGSPVTIYRITGG